jgi:DNA-binding CsgD family transcriptional regulator
MAMSRLIGREPVLAELRTVLAETARGTGSCVVVEGLAGIGKSRVLAEAAAHATGLGLTVATGRATELDRVAPLTALLAALRSSVPPLVGDFSFDLHGAENGGYRLVDRLEGVLAEQATSHPLLIVLDDAQWADELTALALRVLIPALRTSPVCWLLARRPLPARAPGQDAIGSLVEEGATRLRLGPLPADAVAELCTDLLDARPDNGILVLAERASGNPFLLGELLASLRENGRIVVRDGIASVAEGDLPVSFLASVDHRLRDLSEQARSLLEAGAVLGRPYTLHEAAGLVGRTVAELVGTAKEAVHSGALVNVGAELAFRHDLIREAVYHGLPQPVRQALHREAVQVLQTEGRPILEVASHLVRGARKGDDHAVAILREAVRQVAPTAPATAADLMRRVLELLDPNDPDRHVAVAEAIRLLASAGHVVEARDLGEDALRAGLPAADEARILLGLAEALKHAGQAAAVLAYVRRALDRSGVPEPIQAHLLASRAHALMQSDDLAGADRAGAAAVAIGRATGEHSAVAYALAARSAAAQSRGELASAIALASEAVHLADETGGKAGHWHPRLWLASALVAADRFTESGAVYEMGRRQAEQFGTAWSLPLWHYYQGELHVAAGRLEDATAEAETGLRVTERLGALAMAPSLLATMARVALRRDELAMADEHLARARRLVADGVGVVSTDLVWTSALAKAAAGHPMDAVAGLATVYAALPERLLLLTYDPSAGPLLVRLALQARQPELAATAAAAARRLAERNPEVASHVGASAHATGLCNDDLAALRLAVQAYQTSPRPLAMASAMADTARAEHAAGHHDEAVALLDGAMERYTASGANRDVARVRQLMRRLGIRHKSAARGPRGTRAGWRSLTQSELRVVRLVAEGLTNREVASRLFVSPYTVDTHLRHVFTKLDLTSRVELTRQVLAHDDATT